MTDEALSNLATLAGLPDAALVNEDDAAVIAARSVSSLQKLRSSGGGPPFRKLGRLVRYKVGDLRQWADERSVCNTSEGGRG